MRVLLDTKYVRMVIDLKSWAFPLMFDWRYNDMTRPYYASVLCLHFEMGIDPYADDTPYDETINNNNSQ